MIDFFYQSTFKRTRKDVIIIVGRQDRWYCLFNNHGENTFVILHTWNCELIIVIDKIDCIA